MRGKAKDAAEADGGHEAESMAVGAAIQLVADGQHY